MKKTLLAIAAAVAICVLPSCKKESKLKLVTASVVIDESGLAADISKPESYKVTFTNNATAKATEVTSENGVAVAKDLLPGVYTVNASAVTVSEGYMYTISGTQAAASLVNDNTVINIKVTSSKESAFVFKEIFYSGTTVKAPTDPNDPWSGVNYFRDQFYEIYNNSTETVYADGLCIADVKYAEYDYSVIYQWDIENPTQYVFVQTIWQIPGDGKTYPIAPGESIVVAQWATNHNAENLAQGKTLDLSGAEYEAIEQEKTLWNGIVITDGPAINMKKAVNAAGYDMPQWLISVGDAGIILFKTKDELKNSDFIAATNKENVNAREVLISEVLDAVQWHETETDAADISKRFLPSTLDAGCLILPTYSGKSFSRKISGTREDGTVIYQDKNNSSEDFELNDKPQTRRNGAKKPSWNTWGK